MTNDVKQVKITVPEGYEIDRENSTLECIKFKKKFENKFRGSGKPIKGFRPAINGAVGRCGDFYEGGHFSYLIFSTEKEAQSILAMAQLSQIIANDVRFGGPITDDEWCDSFIVKYTIQRWKNIYKIGCTQHLYCFLAFHTLEQRDLFIKENKDLIKQYFMIE